MASRTPIENKIFLNTSIVNGAQTDTTILVQSGPGSNDNEEVLHTL